MKKVFTLFIAFIISLTACNHKETQDHSHDDQTGHDHGEVKLQIIQYSDQPCSF